MVLSLAQQSMFERARRLSAGGQGVGLSEEACAALILVVARDLGISSFDVADDLPELYEAVPASSLAYSTAELSEAMFDRLCSGQIANADTYFACLAALHKARLKYQRILELQPVPTLDQVGPRGLLQYGLLPSRDLPFLLLWRKFLFDIDNRAAQETGYLFEPILAHAIGGTPVSARQSPVKRGSRSGGRQVDAIKGSRAYEFKLRMTIAASGQGRWSEELSFPEEAAASGFIPVLVVLDPTPSPKLTELSTAFVNAGGEVYVGDDAWLHLEFTAGPTMARFLEKYVRKPLQELLAAAVDEEELPDIRVSLSKHSLTFQIGEGGSWHIPRGRADPELLLPEADIHYGENPLGGL